MYVCMYTSRIQRGALSHFLECMFFLYVFCLYVFLVVSVEKVASKEVLQATFSTLTTKKTYNYKAKTTHTTTQKERHHVCRGIVYVCMYVCALFALVCNSTTSKYCMRVRVCVCMYYACVDTCSKYLHIYIYIYT
jgi:hypothetical protein